MLGHRQRRSVISGPSLKPLRACPSRIGLRPSGTGIHRLYRASLGSLSAAPSGRSPSIPEARWSPYGNQKSMGLSASPWVHASPRHVHLAGCPVMSVSVYPPPGAGGVPPIAFLASCRLTEPLPGQRVPAYSSRGGAVVGAFRPIRFRSGRLAVCCPRLDDLGLVPMQGRCKQEICAQPHFFLKTLILLGVLGREKRQIARELAMFLIRAHDLGPCVPRLGIVRGSDRGADRGADRAVCGDRRELCGSAQRASEWCINAKTDRETGRVHKRAECPAWVSFCAQMVLDGAGSDAISGATPIK